MLEETVSLLFSGRTHRRNLTWRERQTVDEFKKLFTEAALEKRDELRFDAQQLRREAAQLDESVGMLEFADAWPSSHPLESGRSTRAQSEKR